MRGGAGGWAVIGRWVLFSADLTFLLLLAKRSIAALEGGACCTVRLGKANIIFGSTLIELKLCKPQGRCIILALLCAIRGALGIYVPGLGTRSGHRVAAGAGITQRGDKRAKKAATAGSEWVNPGAVGPCAQFLARSKKRHSVS